MRFKSIALFLCVLLYAVPAAAQTGSDSSTGSGRSLVKILVGGGALAIGTAIAARSSNTTTVSTINGTSTTSSFSKSQLITGLSIAGVGGIILWDGVRTHDRTSPATQVGLSVGRSGAAVHVRRVF